MPYVEDTIQNYFTPPCAVCKKSDDDCDCLICPVCGMVGDLGCIKHFEDSIAKMSKQLLTMKKLMFIKTQSNTVEGS